MSDGQGLNERGLHRWLRETEGLPETTEQNFRQALIELQGLSDTHDARILAANERADDAVACARNAENKHAIELAGYKLQLATAKESAQRQKAELSKALDQASAREATIAKYNEGWEHALARERESLEKCESAEACSLERKAELLVVLERERALEENIKELERFGGKPPEVNFEAFDDMRIKVDTLEAANKALRKNEIEVNGRAGSLLEKITALEQFIETARLGESHTLKGVRDRMAEAEKAKGNLEREIVAWKLTRNHDANTIMSLEKDNATLERERDELKSRMARVEQGNELLHTGRDAIVAERDEAHEAVKKLDIICEAERGTIRKHVKRMRKLENEVHTQQKYKEQRNTEIARLKREHSGNFDIIERQRKQGDEATRLNSELAAKLRAAQDNYTHMEQAKAVMEGEFVGMRGDARRHAAATEKLTEHVCSLSSHRDHFSAKAERLERKVKTCEEVIREIRAEYEGKGFRSMYTGEPAGITRRSGSKRRIRFDHTSSETRRLAIPSDRRRNVNGTIADAVGPVVVGQAIYYQEKEPAAQWLGRARHLADRMHDVVYGNVHTKLPYISLMELAAELKKELAE